jgi:hypothetical protein
MSNETINQSLPHEYLQFQNITFCGNTFKNLKYLIDDNGFIPFLIGLGDIPRLWIYTKKALNAIIVVQDSVAILPGIRVDIFNNEKKLSVELTQMPGVTNIKIFEMDFSAEIPVVTLIDLRPVGYNVFGDSILLNIGEQKYQGKMFENLHSLVKLENTAN